MKAGDAAISSARQCNRRREPEVENTGTARKDEAGASRRIRIPGAVSEVKGRRIADTHRRRKPTAEVRVRLEAHHRPGRKMDLWRKSQSASRPMAEGGTEAQAKVRHRIGSRRIGPRRKPGAAQTGPAGRWALRREPKGCQPVALELRCLAQARRSLWRRAEWIEFDEKRKCG